MDHKIDLKYDWLNWYIWLIWEDFSNSFLWHHIAFITGNKSPRRTMGHKWPIFLEKNVESFINSEIDFIHILKSEVAQNKVNANIYLLMNV